MSSKHRKCFIALSVSAAIVFTSASGQEVKKSKPGPLMIREQGSFAVAGSVTTAEGRHLLLRYQTSNDRGYHQCLATLLKLKGAGQNQRIGFESQNRLVAEERTGTERQNGRMLPLNANIALAQREDQGPATTEAPTAFRSNGPANAVKDPGPFLKAPE